MPTRLQQLQQELSSVVQFWVARWVAAGAVVDIARADTVTEQGLTDDHAAPMRRGVFVGEAASWLCRVAN